MGYERVHERGYNKMPHIPNLWTVGVQGERLRRTKSKDVTEGRMSPHDRETAAKTSAFGQPATRRRRDEGKGET